MRTHISRIAYGYEKHPYWDTNGHRKWNTIGPYIGQLMNHRCVMQGTFNLRNTTYICAGENRFCVQLVTWCTHAQAHRER